MAVLASCAARRSASDETGRTRLVFVHQPLWGDPAAFDALLAEFERAHPDIALERQLLPNASDLAHQYFVTALEGGGADLDVLVADVVWVPEFARAGWLTDLSAAFPESKLREDFLPAPIDAVLLDGRAYAVPWYVDVGLLYYRTDLVPRAPRTYEELARFAADARKRDPNLQGYLWQGRQYEGLVCNVYERIWGHGGTSLEHGALALDTAPVTAALTELRGLVESGVSPASVTSAAEEDSRRAFQAGGAVFMRNWPYAWTEANSDASPIRGKVAFGALPSQSGEPGPGTLGGWQLAVASGRSPKRLRAALALIEHLTSAHAEEVLALKYARNPARRSVYQSPRLAEGAPFIAGLLPFVERAKPRPATPYYGMVSDILQSEFSAAVAGIRSPDEAMARAQAQADRVMGVSR